MTTDASPSTADPNAPWTQPVGYTPALYQDLFPATVTFPLAPSSTPYAKARVMLTAPDPTSPTPDESARVFVFVDGPQGPRVVVSAAYDPEDVYGDTNTGLDIRITAPHPAILSIRPQGGCGCGSRLTTFHPFTQMRHTQAPASKGPLPHPALAETSSPDPTSFTTPQPHLQTA